MNSAKDKNLLSKTKYYQYKFRIKLWETNFIEKFGRKPDKTDILAADITIREAYNTYWNLKTKVFEEKLKESDSNYSKECMNVKRSNSDAFSFDLNEVSSSNECLYSLFENKNNINKLWGQHLNVEKKNVIDKKNQSTFGNSHFQLTQNAFKLPNFSKRHPRKLVSDKKADVNTENSSQYFKEINLHNENNMENINFNIYNDSECSKKQFKVITLQDKVTSESSNTFQKFVQMSPKINSRLLLSNDYLTKCTESEISYNYTTQKLKNKTDSVLSNFNNCDDYILNNVSEENDNNKRVRNDNKILYDDNITHLKKSCYENNSEIHDFISVEKKLFKSNENYTCMSDSCDSNSDNKSKNQPLSEDLITKSSKIIKSSNILIKTKDTDEINLFKTKSVKELNKNFRRINLKKKVFVQGKKSFNFSSYKKNIWKKKKQNLESNKSKLDFTNTDYGNDDFLGAQCEEDHLANQYKSSENFEIMIPVKDNLQSSLQNTESTRKSASNTESKLRNDNSLKFNVLQNTESTRKSASNTESKLRNDNSLKFNEYLSHECEVPVIKTHLVNREINPLYNLNVDGSLKDTPPEVFSALNKFGHKQFRNGQENAIMRTLSGLSTLVTLATGSGKSLCYQLPAYLYAQRSKCISLIISPLVSLMDDQVSKIPKFLPAACLHTNQSPKLHANIISNIKAGNIVVLLVSPETIVAGGTFCNFLSLVNDLPPIAFACIDEAHCISEWSHNFRPSYLMICKFLKENLKIRNILALTATASNYTIASMIDLLHIKDKTAGVISEKPLSSNIYLTISYEKHKDDALISLLQSTKFAQYNSIIIYCTRREECSRLAGLLRIYLQDQNSKLPRMHQIKKNQSSVAEAYHAGLSAHRRKSIYTAFINSKIRIIVATVAFGMGIDKPDVRAVIHYNMPSNFESYVQEIGRAGRDGLPAHCHLFLNAQDNSDESELRRHINVNGIDRYTIRRLLEKVFIPCNCTESRNKSIKNQRCQGHEVAFSIEETVKNLDITQETITTLLCYLELNFKCFIKLFPCTYINAKICSYNGPEDLVSTAQSSPLLAMVIALLIEKRTYQANLSSVNFSVIDIASIAGVECSVIKDQLKKLEWIRVNDEWRRSAISVKFDTLGFHIRASGDLTTKELDDILDYLTRRSESQISRRLKQLENISSILRKFSYSSVHDCLNITGEIYDKSEELKNIIRTYFESDYPESLCSSSEFLTTMLKNEEQVKTDIRNLISSYQNTNFTGRSIARIFHGIESPNYPALIWSSSRFWRIHIDEDFNKISHVAVKEILNMK